MRLARVTAALLFVSTMYTLSALGQARNEGRTGMTLPSAAGDPMPGDNPSLGTISGSVRSIDGHAVKDATVEVRDNQRGNRVVTGRTDASGSFTLYNIPSGDYDVIVTLGVSETHERVRLDSMSRNTTVDFRLPDKTAADMNSDKSTISVSHYQVPGKARSQYEKAAQAMAHGKLDQAREKVDAALKSYPKFPEALTLRGILKAGEGKNAEAIADLQQAIQYDPNYALSYAALAASLNSEARFDDSLMILNQGERLAPNMWQIHFEFARAEIGKGDYAASLHHLDRASELKGGPQAETPEMHLVRGYALVGANDLHRAQQEIEVFLAREPNGRAAETARKMLDQLRAESVTATK